MTGKTRSKSAWGWGALIAAVFFLLSGTRGFRAMEGHVLALGSRIASPAASSGAVVVVALPWELPAETFGVLMRYLSDSKAVGLVPPFPRSVLNAAPVNAPAPVVQGLAQRKISAGLPERVPLGMKVWPEQEIPPLPPLALIPGLLGGTPDPTHPLDVDPASIFPSDAAVLDFVPGEAPLHRAPLVVRTADAWMPTFALSLASAAAGREIGPTALKELRIEGPRGSLGTDWGYRAYPRPLSVDVPVVSVLDVLSGRWELKDKVVLIGLADSAQVEPVVFAWGEARAPVVAEAQLTAALLDRALYTIPPWSIGAQAAVFLVIAMVLSLLLPRISAGAGLILTLLLAFMVLTGEFALLSLKATYVPLSAPVLALFAGNTVFLMKKRGETRLLALGDELASANRLLGQAYQSQGQLDAALDRFRRCPMDEELKESLYTLGLDFERRRQFGKAAATFGYLAERAPKFRDVAERLKRNRDADGQVLFGAANPATPTGTVILADPGLARPTLGRYEVERELGRGAMGTVYLGRDPKIGRTVAIKTMALAQEFDGEGLTAVRQRFFREAETAGRLAHPNIVTIYDVGEEEDLAYIAMDYLKGQSLAAYARADTLLPFAEVMEIGEQVAEALDYAHERNVVHRDIKPANIIYDRDEGVVKVTDFGVACLTDNSKTRTGTVLGSPSYMSPEQVAGRKVDGRADLFSLGVTLFQLLTGELPFKGDSLASLMYRIANEKPAEVRKFRRDLPSCAARIINKALQKEVDKRYQSGSEMAAALRRCREGGKG